MDKNENTNRKYFYNSVKKRQNALKSTNNYLGQLKLHFELSNDEMFDILKIILSQHKKLIKSSKKWWHFFD